MGNKQLKLGGVHGGAAATATGHAHTGHSHSSHSNGHSQHHSSSSSVLAGTGAGSSAGGGGSPASLHQQPSPQKQASPHNLHASSKADLPGESVNMRERHVSPCFVNVSKDRLYIAIAAYNEKRAPDDLLFNKGDLMEIVNWNDDPNWWLAKNERGEKGWIPSSFITQCESLETYSWFNGKISRKHAELKLQGRKSGTFLIRESTTNAGDFTISMIQNDRVLHYLIKKINHTKFYINSPEMAFQSLGSMVEWHRKNLSGLKGYLKYPCPRDPVTAEIYGTSDTKDKWELKKEEITLETKLGSGQYGDVYQGKWRNMKVAVKQLKALATEGNDWKKEFMMESGIMKKLHHPNLVQLLGVCTEAQPYYIVTELLVKKSLLEFLRSVEGRSNLDAQALLRMSIEVCSAMVYLEEHKYIHRDLAARNCLVGADYTVKVADFGLSRLVEGGENVYTASEGAKFPIKWTAPEALEYNKFTTMSDVWSYGILLWEISSLGKVPYPDTQLGDVITRIRSGYRLPSPSGCPADIYTVMRACWHYEPAMRPTFKSQQESLVKIQEEMSGGVSVLDLIQGNGKRDTRPSTSSPQDNQNRTQPQLRFTQAKWLLICDKAKEALRKTLMSNGASYSSDELIAMSNEMLNFGLAACDEFWEKVDAEAQNDTNEVMMYLSSHIAYAEKSIHLWSTHERAEALDNYFRILNDTEVTLAGRLPWNT